MLGVHQQKNETKNCKAGVGRVEDSLLSEYPPSRLNILLGMIAVRVQPRRRGWPLMKAGGAALNHTENPAVTCLFPSFVWPRSGPLAVKKISGAWRWPPAMWY